jgi:hypothetical protein
MQAVHKNLHILGLVILFIIVLKLPISLSANLHKHQKLFNKKK